MAEVAFRYGRDEETKILIFVNGERIFGGGVEVEGLLRGLAGAVNRYAQEAGEVTEDWQKLTPDEMRRKLTAVIALRLSDPQFYGALRTRMQNVEAGKLVEKLVMDILHERSQNEQGIPYQRFIRWRNQ